MSPNISILYTAKKIWGIVFLYIEKLCILPLERLK